MPAQPTASFIVVQTDFTLAFFKEGLDWPAHTAETHKVLQGDVRWGVAEIELGLVCSIPSPKKGKDRAVV